MADLAGLAEEPASLFPVSGFSFEVLGKSLDCFVSVEVDCGQVLNERFEPPSQRLAVIVDLFLNFGILEERCGDGSLFCETQGEFGAASVDAEVLDKALLASLGKRAEKIAGKGRKQVFGIRSEELPADVPPLIFHKSGVGDSFGQGGR